MTALNKLIKKAGDRRMEIQHDLKRPTGREWTLHVLTRFNEGRIYKTFGSGSTLELACEDALRNWK